MCYETPTLDETQTNDESTTLENVLGLDETPAPAPVQPRTFKSFTVKAQNNEKSITDALLKKFKNETSETVMVKHFHGQAEPNHTYATTLGADYILKSATRVAKGSRWFNFRFVQV